MSTPDEAVRRRVRRGRRGECDLSEFPAWGLEIMMGLYGPETIKNACGADCLGTSRRGDDGEPEAAAGGACGDRDIDGTGTDGAGADRGHGRTADDTPLTPIHAEIDAVVAVGDLFGRLFRRR